MTAALFCLTSAFCFCAAVGFAQSDAQKKSFPLLDGLSDIARSDDCRVYNICEIDNGVSQTAVIRPAIRCHNTYSVAKLFVVTALGILEDRGLLDTEELVFPIFKDRFPEGYDPKWERVKVSDVIKHRFGLENGILDIDSENSADWPTTDFLSIVLSAPLKYEPGEKFVYSDAAYYLLSRIVTEKTGKKFDEFLREELLVPMKFAEYAFSTCPQGYPIGATGMYISTDDMAKLGQLYVDRGVYGGKRYISERFVDKVFDREFELSRLDESGSAYAKGGMNGQLLYVNRKTKRVIAIHSFRGDIDRMMKYLLEFDR